MPNINLDDAYILGETGAEVDKVTGLFTKDEDTTSGEKAFAQLNIGTAGSNRNLLDNPWFLKPVNQRGASNIPSGAYGIDRWKGEHYSGASVTITNAGLVYDPGTFAADVYQPLEASLRAWMNGKIFTASILKGDGTIISGTTAYTNGSRADFITSAQSGGIDCYISPAGNFNCRSESAVTIVAVKLERGSVSTLENDAPPEYTDELNKCRYYFRRIGLRGDTGTLLNGAAALATNALFYLDGPMNNNTGSISFTGAFSCNDNAVAGFEHKVTLDGIRINAITSGLTVNGSVVLRQTNVNSHIDISHDL